MTLKHFRTIIFTENDLFSVEPKSMAKYCNIAYTFFNDVRQMLIGLFICSRMCSNRFSTQATQQLPRHHFRSIWISQFHCTKFICNKFVKTASKTSYYNIFLLRFYSKQTFFGMLVKTIRYHKCYKPHRYCTSGPVFDKYCDIDK